MLRVQPQPQPAPTLGVVIVSNGAFSPDAKDHTDAATRALFDRLQKAGTISSQSLIVPHLSDPITAFQAADKLAAAQVDLVVIVNIAFPNGQLFLSIATNPYLAKIPVAVVADPEPSAEEWATNAWCGVIMNNHVAKKLGRPLATVPGPVEGKAFEAELHRLIRVARTIKWLRRDFLGRFGDAPGGFHSATLDPITFAGTFGTMVDTVDLTAVMEAYKNSRITGYLGDSAFSQEEVDDLVKQVLDGREVEVPMEDIKRACRLYFSYRAVIRANGYTSAAFRCWPEMNEPYIKLSSCLSISLLLTNGDVTAASCESDWPIAVAQTMGAILSGTAAYCLDWVNYTGGSEIIQLGHCGVGVCGAMADKPGKCGGPCDLLTVHPVLRQAGNPNGPVLVGQYAYGPKTGIGLMQKADGKFAVLSFEGENTPETARGMKYSAADLLVPKYSELNEIVLGHGFPHHLAVATGSHSQDIALLCKFLGVEHVSP